MSKQIFNIQRFFKSEKEEKRKIIRVKNYKIPTIKSSDFIRTKPNKINFSEELSKKIETSSEKIDGFKNWFEKTNFLKEYTFLNINISKNILKSFKQQNDIIETEIKKQKILLDKEEAKTEESNLENKKDDEKDIASKKKIKKIKFSVNLLKSILEPVFKVFIDATTFASLWWLSDKRNTDKIERAFYVVRGIGSAITKITSFGVNNILDGLSNIFDTSMFDDGDITFGDVVQKIWQVVKGVGQVYIGIKAIGLVFLKFPLKELKFIFKQIRKAPSRLKALGMRLFRWGKTAVKWLGNVGRWFKKSFKFVYKKLLNSKVLSKFKKLLKISKLKAFKKLKVFKKFLSKTIPLIGKNGMKIGGNLAKIFTKIPFLGSLIEFGINKFILGMPTDESAVRALGSAIGAFVVGAVTGVLSGGVGAAPGAILGGMVGDAVAAKIYELFSKNTPELAEGGFVNKPTIALIGESGGEYVIPEDRMGESTLDFPKVIIGSTEAFLNSLGSSNSSFYSESRNLISPYKRQFGSEKYVFGSKFSNQSLSQTKEINLFGLEENEINELNNSLDLIFTTLREDKKNPFKVSSVAKTISDVTERVSNNIGFNFSAIESEDDVINAISKTSNLAFNRLSNMFGRNPASGSDKDGMPMESFSSGMIGQSSFNSANPKFINPLPNGTITSRYGMRWGRLHKGTDISSVGGSGKGSAVYAAADGKVKIASSGYNGGYGNYVVIEHGGGWETLYAHLHSISTTKDRFVKSGDVIGYEGDSGASDGTHLHFEVKRNGTALNVPIKGGNSWFTVTSSGSGNFNYDDRDSPELADMSGSGKMDFTPSLSPMELTSSFKIIAAKLGLINKKIEKDDLKVEGTEDIQSEPQTTTVVINKKNLNNVVTNLTLLEPDIKPHQTQNFELIGSIG